MYKLVLGIVAVAVAALVYGGDDLPLPPPTRTMFDPQEIRLEVGSGVEAKAFVSTDVASLENLDLLAVTDIASTGGAEPPLKVTFGTPQRISTAKATWVVPVTVDAMPPGTFTRVAQFEFTDNTTHGKKTDSATYVIISRPKGFSWTVSTGANTLSYKPNDGFPITVLATGGRASNFRLEDTSLQSSEGTAITPALLCLSKVSVSEATLAVPETSANSTCVSETIPMIEEGVRTQFIVRFRTNEIPSGTYSGSVNFAVDESPDSKSVNLTFHTSSARRRVFGFILILAGVALSILVAAVLRPFIANAEALMPAVRLAEIVGARKAQIEACGASRLAPKTIHTLNAIVADVSERELRLRGFLQGRIMNPFQTGPADTLAAYLEERNNELAAIGYLIDHGLCAAASRVIDANSHAHVRARNDAFEALDALGERRRQTLEQIMASVPTILAEFDRILSTNLTKMSQESDAGRPALPTMHQLLFRVTVLSAFAWLVVMILTVVTGYAVLIATNRGFGVPLDLFKCFLWGLGVQTAGQQFAQTTSSSIVSSFGFVSAPQRSPEL